MRMFNRAFNDSKWELKEKNTSILGGTYISNFAPPEHQTTVFTQIERRRSNNQICFFDAVWFKFWPNLTVVNQVFALKSGLLVKKVSSAALIKSAVVFASIRYVWMDYLFHFKYVLAWYSALEMEKIVFKKALLHNESFFFPQLFLEKN